MPIKNIIFDLGGVLLNLNYQNTIDAFLNLGISDFESLYSQAQQNDLFDAIETGKINEKDFITELKKFLPDSVTDFQIMNAWNAMLLDLPKERLTFLLKIKQKYRTVLLSNTNKIHLESFHKRLKKDFKLDSLATYFNHLYYSCDLGMRKPHPEIFQKVCELENFIPEETLFVDDSIQHIEGAKKTGLKTLHLDVKQTNVVELLSFLLA